MIDLDFFDDEVNTNENSLHTQEAAHTSSNGNKSEQEANSKGPRATPIKTGLFDGISNQQYHDSPGISSTELKPGLKSMYLYNERRSGRIPFVQTAAMRLGTAVHKLVLEAMDFPNEIAISKKFGRTKAEQEAKLEFQKEHEGKVVITADEYEECRRMRDAIMLIENIDKIFSTGKAEQSGYYLDSASARNESTHMLCKYRPDWRTDWCIADVKCTVDASAEAFSRTINNFGYHISADHYLEGDRILKQTEHRQFIFLCVEPGPEYHAAMYRLGSESLELGHELRRSTLGKIKKAREDNYWSPLNEGVCLEIDVPNYALNQLREMKV